MKKFSSILFFISFASIGYTQSIDDVIVDANAPRNIERAYRLTIDPKIIDSVIPSPEIEYSLLALQYDTKIETEKIEAATIKTVEKLPQLYHAYVKLGVGTEFMPLGEIYFNNTRSRKYFYGAHLKHLSSFGNIPNYAPAKFDRTKFNLFGNVLESKYSYGGDFHFNSIGFGYYGIQNENLDRDSIGQRYHDTGLSTYFSSHKKDSANVNFKVGMEYNNFSSRKPTEDSLSEWRGRENYFAIKTSAFYKQGNEIYSGAVDIKYNGYKYGSVGDSLSAIDTNILLNNTVISLRPNISTYLQNNRFKADFGLNITFDFHRKTKAYIYPNIEVKYSLFNDIFIPYAGLRGGLNQTTYKSLAARNEFIQTNLSMYNEHTPIDFYGGIKGTLSQRVSFDIHASFATVKNKALFVTDTLYSLGNQFNVIYDTMGITTIEGSLSYQLREKIKIDAIGRYVSYTPKSNPYAWNLPTFQAILRTSYNLYDKFLINLDMDFEGGRKALVYAPGENVTIEDGVFVYDLGFIADVNLGLEYRYNKRISAFVQFNNLAAQRYERWYRTPVQAFQFLGGVTFRF